MLSLTGVLHAETVVEGFNPYAEKVYGCLSGFTSAKTSNEEKMAPSIRQQNATQWIVVILGIISSILGGLAENFRENVGSFPPLSQSSILLPALLPYMKMFRPTSYRFL
jgi:hypothetical protein